MIEANNHPLWVERYRPQTIDQYVFHDVNQETSVMQMIQQKNIPHLLLSGTHGSGKTSLSQILIRTMELDSVDVLTINASDERGIDTFRNTIKSFATTMAMGRFKIIHLEEADMLTPPAQSALKRFMEETSEYVRFILTCNHVNKILPPIRSRCQEFFFKAGNPDDIAEYLITILSSEGISFELDLLDKYIAHGYPDIRKIINNLQQNSVNGVLQIPAVFSDSSDYKFKLLDLIEANKWIDARKLVCASVNSDEWENLYRFLYENISKSPKFATQEAWESAIVTIADHLYKHSVSSDPEINAASMFIQLTNIK
jgi:replication factor C small subunit